MKNIGVLGAGTWGMALARMLSVTGHDVTVWSAIGREIDEFSATRRHPNLPNMIIPDQIRFTKDIAQVCRQKDILLFAVPSVFVRSTAAVSREFIPDGQTIVDVAKGIEPDTLMSMSEVIGDELRKDGKHDHVKLVALSGPTHAEEVAMDMPTAIVSACPDLEVAAQVQDIFMNTCMRVYTNSDIVGVELCGALKNIIALASGVCVGLGYGDNIKAALITRGMAEITRLGTAMGGEIQTFSGLAGMGDLIVTATSEHSRNNRCGRLLGQGMPPEDAARTVGMVVEGINALPAAVKLAQRYQVEMPIVMAVNAVVNEGMDPREAFFQLMNRNKKNEIPQKKQKRVITYGTFDLLHFGHINLLRRAKELGDYLVVALSTDEFNWNEKQKKCYFSYEKRKALLEAVRYVDEVIPETCWEQKRTDIHTHTIDVFVMGDDWEGKFDFLREEGAEVVYLPRTPEISTTQIKSDLHN